MDIFSILKLITFDNLKRMYDMLLKSVGGSASWFVRILLNILAGSLLIGFISIVVTSTKDSVVASGKAGGDINVLFSSMKTTIVERIGVVFKENIMNGLSETEIKTQCEKNQFNIRCAFREEYGKISSRVANLKDILTNLIGDSKSNDTSNIYANIFNQTKKIVIQIAEVMGSVLIFFVKVTFGTLQGVVDLVSKNHTTQTGGFSLSMPGIFSTPKASPLPPQLPLTIAESMGGEAQKDFYMEQGFWPNEAHKQPNPDAAAALVEAAAKSNGVLQQNSDNRVVRDWSKSDNVFKTFLNSVFTNMVSMLQTGLYGVSVAGLVSIFLLMRFAFPVLNFKDLLKKSQMILGTLSYGGRKRLK